MKIIGGRDYYDCGMAMGVDPSIRMIRGKSGWVPLKDAGGSLLSKTLKIRSGNPWGQEDKSIAVAFCNKVYRGVLLPNDQATAWDGIWTADKFRSWIDARKRDRKPVSVEVPWNWAKNLPRTNTLDAAIDEYFTPREVPEEMRRWMIMNRVSILVEEDNERVKDRCFEVNPDNLKRYGFQRAVDPYTAYQELSMWIGGVLGGTSPEIVKIKDDKTLIEGHGFDNRISFRGPRIA